jgi:hypothetical protein
MFERWRTHRRLTRAPELDDTTTEGSLVRVTGIVRVLDRSLRAPRTGCLCVGWRVRMLVGGGDRGSFGTFEGSELVPFAVESEGRRVLIRSTDARFDLQSTTDLLDPDRWAEYCEDRGIERMHPGEELAIEPGTTISVAGIATISVDGSSPVGEGGYRDEANRLWQLAGDFDHPVWIGRSR